MHRIFADGRWSGAHGIGRFSTEILARLTKTDILNHGPKPLSLQNIVWQSRELHRVRKKYDGFFSPGFNPVVYSPMPYVITVHDLIHLFAPGNAKWQQKLFYQFLIKPTILRAHRILTVSDFSKKTIAEWASIPDEKIITVGCGISENFKTRGEKFSPGFPYLLHVGNTEKTHKNIPRLLQAFAECKIDSGLRLIFTSPFSAELNQLVQKHHLQNRVEIHANLTENTLADYYRGATAVVFPSLYEGFGLPVAEGMACGVPVLTSNVTSMPEVAGDAALLINPYSVESIQHGIEKIITDNKLRTTLVTRGLQRATSFSWDKTAQMVQKVLETV